MRDESSSCEGMYMFLLEAMVEVVGLQRGLFGEMVICP